MDSQIYRRQAEAYGNVAYGYFMHSVGQSTWIAPDWREWADIFPEYVPLIEREIDRRIRIVAMGA